MSVVCCWCKPPPNLRFLMQPRLVLLIPHGLDDRGLCSRQSLWDLGWWICHHLAAKTAETTWPSWRQRYRSHASSFKQWPTDYKWHFHTHPWTEGVPMAPSDFKRSGKHRCRGKVRWLPWSLSHCTRNQHIIDTNRTQHKYSTFKSLFPTSLYSWKWGREREW